MYHFIFWMCLAQHPDCTMWHAAGNRLIVQTMDSMADCEALWKQTTLLPDPDNMKSYHVCKPAEEDL